MVTSSDFMNNGRTAQNGVSRELKPLIGNIVACPIRMGVVRVVVSELAPPLSMLPMALTPLSPSVLESALPNEDSVASVPARSLVAELNIA